ncbi:MAG: hypothetical protein ACJ79S_17345 [Gemmatimonadaceae bacterium]
MTDPGTTTTPMPPASGAADEPAVLSRSALLSVRLVLHAHRDGWRLDERLAAAASMVADDARARSAPAEAMLIALKRGWAELEEVRQLPARDVRALLDRLITLAIRALYAPHSSPQDRGTRARGPQSAAHEATGDRSAA